MISRILSIAVAVLLAGNMAWAQRAKPKIQWAKDWKEACAEAKARNVPIMYSLHQDD